MKVRITDAAMNYISSQVANKDNLGCRVFVTKGSG
jgi:Fe-S cluster assembly iron-binding protein IscA